MCYLTVQKEWKFHFLSTFADLHFMVDMTVTFVCWNMFSAFSRHNCIQNSITSQDGTGGWLCPCSSRWSGLYTVWSLQRACTIALILLARLDLSPYLVSKMCSGVQGIQAPVFHTEVQQTNPLPNKYNGYCTCSWLMVFMAHQKNLISSIIEKLDSFTWFGKILQWGISCPIKSSSGGLWIRKLGSRVRLTYSIFSQVRSELPNHFCGTIQICSHWVPTQRSFQDHWEIWHASFLTFDRLAYLNLEREAWSLVCGRFTPRHYFDFWKMSVPLSRKTTTFGLSVPPLITIALRIIVFSF